MDRDTKPTEIEVPEVVAASAPTEVVHQAGTVSIPSDFTRLLCCAVSCNNWGDGCFGCKSDTTCCCLYGDNVCWKWIGDDKTCCITRSGKMECIQPDELCRKYAQCFCFECYAALPLTEDGYRIPVVGVDHLAQEDKPIIGDALLYQGLCCTMTGINLSCPLYLGKYTHSDMLCCFSESIVCMPKCGAAHKTRENQLCILSNGTSALVYPTVLAKAVSVCLCVDSRCALPCDEDVPCVCTFLPFCTCCVKGQCLCGCCQTYSQLTGHPTYKGPPMQAPVPQEAIQATPQMVAQGQTSSYAQVASGEAHPAAAAEVATAVVMVENDDKSSAI